MKNYCSLLLFFVVLTAFSCVSKKTVQINNPVAPGDDSRFKNLGNQDAGGSIQAGTFPKTMKYTVLRKGARFLTMDNQGTLYTVMGETLWQFRP